MTNPTKLKLKKLNSDAVVPSYAKPGDAGLDLTVRNYDLHPEQNRITYYTGISVEIPQGMVGLLFPRSSIFQKKGLRMTNSVGVIDSGYRGEIKAVFEYYSLENTYRIGDRFAQLVVVPIPFMEVEVVDELSETERGEGGYGSTGN